jgi:hypothetical protein
LSALANPTTQTGRRCDPQRAIARLKQSGDPVCRKAVTKVEAFIQLWFRFVDIQPAQATHFSWSKANPKVAVRGLEERGYSHLRQIGTLVVDQMITVVRVKYPVRRGSNPDSSTFGPDDLVYVRTAIDAIEFGLFKLLAVEGIQSGARSAEKLTIIALDKGLKSG